MIQKDLCNTAVLSYRPLLEGVALRLVASVASFQGAPGGICQQVSLLRLRSHIQPQTGVSVTQPIVFQSTQQSIHQDRL